MDSLYSHLFLSIQYTVPSLKAVHVLTQDADFILREYLSICVIYKEPNFVDTFYRHSQA
jgi:hypothetical protein